MTTTPEPHQTDLREYLRVLRARKWEIILITLVVVLATMAFTIRQTPIYQGEAKILVNAVQNPANPLLVSQPNLDTERQLVLSQAVAVSVQKAHAPGTSLHTLTDGLSAEVITNTSVLVVRYASTSPSTAATLSNAFAQAYVDFRTNQALNQYQAAQDAVNGQIDGVKKDLATLGHQIDATTDPTELSNLQSQRDSLVARLGVLQQQLSTLVSNATVAQGTAAQIVQRAEVPTSPSSPNKVRNGVLALLAGLMLGTGFAFLRERLDDRVKGRQDIERRLSAPVLAVVPKVGAWRKDQEAYLALESEPRSPVSEAYRTLATNLQYLSARQGMKVFLLTSPLAGDGKTTTCANLAVALAQAGRRVIVVSADLRKPRIHRFFGLSNDVGLADYLQGKADIAQVTKDPRMPNLRLVSCGPTPTNPAALLGSGAASTLISALRELSDFVIVDTPPVLAVADSSILAPLMDGVLLVLDASGSRRSLITQTRDQLHAAGGHIIGAVYNNFDPSQARGYSEYYYYYQYYYQYYGEDVPATNGAGAEKRKRPRRGPRADEQPLERADKGLFGP